MAKDDINAAVSEFTARINKALQGDNIAEDIQKAVWDLLKDLDVNVEFPGR